VILRISAVRHRSALVLALSLALVISSRAETLSIDIPPLAPAGTGYFKLGTTRNPAGHELNLNSHSLLLDGQPWFPVMGEFHYTRCPAAEWREELLKMKAGGVDIVATYVFWIHHEEVEGQWDWSERRDLRKFVQTCQEAGLKVIVRCGPWCHGEVRNGGFPDWVQAHKDWKLRSPDTHFMAAVQTLYAQIAEQLRGEYWKDGGPVIGVQVDNEFRGPAAYLLGLKKLAIQSGIDVPYYIRTGWPMTTTPVPAGELLPLFGGYADGFWLGATHAMPGDEWKKYLFTGLRTDTAIGADQLGKLKEQDSADAAQYPNLCCEIGGGMEPSYRRRVWLKPEDTEALVLAKLGSGTSLLGYYMYHGGQNPEGKLSTLNESQASGYPNDMPVKSYDFNAPLGEYGQINPQYHWLRRLHLFIHDFGAALAPMPALLPATGPTNGEDIGALRWVVRSDGKSGYVFVNNYQRLRPMRAHANVQFHLRLPGGETVFPARPTAIPPDRFFFWPFNLDLGGVTLAYATAQPVCQIDEGDVRTVFFAKTPDVKAEFAVAAGAGKPAQVCQLKPDRNAGAEFARPAGGKVRIVLLTEEDSLKLWRGRLAGAERVVLSPAGVAFDGDEATLTSEDPQAFQAEIFPAPKDWPGEPDGVFRRLAVRPVAAMAPALLSTDTEVITAAGPAREIPLSPGRAHLPLAPDDRDFTQALTWKISLLDKKMTDPDQILRIRYAGDAARFTLNGRVIDDNYYCGREFDLGVKRYLPELLKGNLQLQILPLRTNAPIFLEDRARPDFDGRASLAALRSIKLIHRYHFTLTSLLTQ